jgi:hypothetical protein
VIDLDIDYEELMDDSQQLAAYYEVKLYEGSWDLEFLEEALDFLADRYKILLLLQDA